MIGEKLTLQISAIYGLVVHSIDLIRHSIVENITKGVKNAENP